MSEKDYEEIALSVFPPGCKPSVVRARNAFALILEKEVSAALTRQREAGFPELSQVRKAMEEERDEMKKKLKIKQDELEVLEKSLRQKDSALQQKMIQLAQDERRITNLVKAFESYVAWLEGAGEVDENGKRFKALREAWESYKGAKR